jgi:hypothetical protein
MTNTDFSEKRLLQASAGLKDAVPLPGKEDLDAVLKKLSEPKGSEEVSLSIIPGHLEKLKQKIEGPIKLDPYLKNVTKDYNQVFGSVPVDTLASIAEYSRNNMYELLFTMEQELGQLHGIETYFATLDKTVSQAASEPKMLKAAQEMVDQLERVLAKAESRQTAITAFLEKEQQTLVDKYRQDAEMMKLLGLVQDQLTRIQSSVGSEKITQKIGQVKESLKTARLAYHI